MASLTVCIFFRQKNSAKQRRMNCDPKEILTPGEKQVVLAVLDDKKWALLNDKPALSLALAAT